MTISLEDRGRALEDEFFNKENAKKIEALKEKLDDKRSREDLRKASGMTDDAVLDKAIDDHSNCFDGLDPRFAKFSIARAERER